MTDGLKRAAVLSLLLVACQRAETISISGAPIPDAGAGMTRYCAVLLQCPVVGSDLPVHWNYNYCINPIDGGIRVAVREWVDGQRRRQVQSTDDVVWESTLPLPIRSPHD